jgi:hypothetical protein
VSFPVSCGADIQPRFDAAAAALHSFWYGQDLKEFPAISEATPDCAMAYWGMEPDLGAPSADNPRTN